MDELLRDFLTETSEHIEGAETQLVQFERDPSNASLISSIFRLVHTIKGTSSFLGLERLQRVAHAAETVMGKLRDGAPPTKSAVSLILAAIDRIKAILADIEQTGAEPQDDDTDLIRALEAHCNTELLASDGGEEKAAGPTPQAASDLEPEPSASSQAPSPSARNQSAGNSNRNQETIRVSVDTIERIMQLVSELVLTRNQLLELARHRDDDTFKTPLQHLSTLTTDLQDAVMRARMQPVGRLYANLPRLVRELSTSLGKKIDLVTEGADTELDRQLIEVLRDPLTHIIRNCADHGLETPDVRVAMGKPEFGEIRVSAAHEAGQITIDISDDGKGLDAERIKRKVISSGLATEAELQDMSPDEIYRFIFEPGFSTAEAVTNVSGRGVGMDVVRSNIEPIGGSVSLSSTPGRGTRFSLKIPLTLAIAPALIIEVSGQRFALPQTSVVEAVSLGRNYNDLIQNVQNSLVLKLRQEVIPAVELSDVLGLESAGARGNDKLAVVMRVGANPLCVIVDGVADIQEIVVKPLSASLSHLKSFSGHTILGDGSVVLILDPGGIAAHLGIEKSAEKKREVASEQSGAMERRRLVMFRAGAGASKVLPLSVVSRIEMIETSRIEKSDGRLVVLLQDRLTPLELVSPAIDLSRSSYPVLVVTVDDRTIGLLAEEIVDIIEEKLEIQLASRSADIIGSAEIRGDAVELIDVTHFIAAAHPTSCDTADMQRILLVADDPMLHDMLIPPLSAAGYGVTVASLGEDGILERASACHAVVVDMDVPGINASRLMCTLKQNRAALPMPVLGLATHPTPRATRSATKRGITALVSKLDRPSLLNTLTFALDAAAEAQEQVELAA
jgi:two-component system chemotaxis sensor kinase CheA